MARQSISLTKPNDEWLKAQVQSEEYSSKSEVVNDIIRQVRRQQAEIDLIRAKIKQAEARGFSKSTPAEILAKAKSRLNG